MPGGGSGTSGKMAEAIKTLRALHHARRIIDQGIIAAKRALRLNPTPNEERQINAQIFDLAEQLARVQAKLNALRARLQAQKPPSDAQVAEIAALTRDVERQTNQALAASGTISLVADILEMAQSVDFG